MNFRSIADTNELIRAGLDKVPPDVDLIVGVPRSGMLPATMLALHMNLPLTDVDGFVARKLMKSGSTRGQQEIDFARLRHALVVDDSVFSGGTMRDVRAALRDIDFPKISYAAIYGSEELHDDEVITFETVSAPRAFEWNVMYHPFILQHACLDLDGILCFDPKTEQNDGQSAYDEFLTTARCRYVPRSEVNSIVTSRLEKYRPETEQWLEAQGIKYKFLHMLDLPDEETRRRLGNHAEFKASVYKKSDNYVFIESEEWQAREIARISGRPALSMANSPKMFYGLVRTPRGFIWHLKKSPFLRKIFRKSPQL